MKLLVSKMMILFVTSSEVNREEENEQEGEQGQEGEEIVPVTEANSENKDIVDESVFREFWGKLQIGSMLER